MPFPIGLVDEAMCWNRIGVPLPVPPELEDELLELEEVLLELDDELLELECEEDELLELEDELLELDECEELLELDDELLFLEHLRADRHCLSAFADTDISLASAVEEGIAVWLQAARTTEMPQSSRKPGARII